VTQRQLDILGFINQHIADKRYPPTVREIAAHFNIRSPNGVNCHLKALTKAGVLEVVPRISRGLRVIAPTPAKPRRKGVRK
jgi:repressor LexA